MGITRVADTAAQATKPVADVIAAIPLIPRASTDRILVARAVTVKILLAAAAGGMVLQDAERAITPNQQGLLSCSVMVEDRVGGQRLPMSRGLMHYLWQK